MRYMGGSIYQRACSALLLFFAAAPCQAQDGTVPFLEAGSLIRKVQAEQGGGSTLFRWSSEDPNRPDPGIAETITTDRPDFTEASSTVGAGVAQVEMGYTFSHDDSAGVTTESHSLPETLFRYGTPIDWLELRLATNYLRENSAGSSIDGAEDLYLGAKLGLTLQDGLLPEMAIVPQMTIPSGADGLSGNRVLPGLNWLYGWDVNDFISTAGSTQFNHAVDGGTGGPNTEWAQSWTVGYSLHDRVAAYTEWFVLVPHSAETAQTQHYANGGFTVLLSDDIQWDIRAGMGLNDAADDLFVGTGLSVRYR